MERFEVYPDSMSDEDKIARGKIINDLLQKRREDQKDHLNKIARSYKIFDRRYKRGFKIRIIFELL